VKKNQSSLLKLKAAQQDLAAVLGKNCEFKGTLSYDGQLRIEGIFQGEIFSKDTLFIGEDAVVEARIEVGHAIISGKVRGRVKAHTIELYPPAEVQGELIAHYLKLEEGVLFEGKSEILPQERL